MLSLAPLLPLLLGLGSSLPVLAPPPPQPQATPDPAMCCIEVRLRDASTTEQGRRPDRLIARGTLEIRGGKAEYRTGERIPVVTYSFDNQGWKAYTTFQDAGVTLKLLESRRHDGVREVTYECRVGCVLDVVAGSPTPILGDSRWSGSGLLSPGKPIVLTALSRVDGRLRRLPRNHPLQGDNDPAPLPDLLVEIEVKVEILPPPRSK